MIKILRIIDLGPLKYNQILKNIKLPLHFTALKNEYSKTWFEIQGTKKMFFELWRTCINFCN
jgi:hypothetical protein